MIKVLAFAAVGLALSACAALADPIVLSSATFGQFDFATTGGPVPLAMTTLGATVSGPAESAGDPGTYVFGVLNPGNVPNVGPESAGVFPIVAPNSDTLTVTLGGGAATFDVTFDAVDGTSPAPTLTGTFTTVSASGDLASYAAMGPFTGTVDLVGLPPVSLEALAFLPDSSEFGYPRGVLGEGVPPSNVPGDSVPEPGTLAVFGAALLGLGSLRWLRRSPS